MSAILELSDVTVRFGGITAVDHVSFTMEAGEITALVGPNGAGKTTLVDALSGFVHYEGSVALRGRTIDGLRPDQRAKSGLRRTFQSLDLFDDLTVRENVAVGASRPGAVVAALAASGLASLADERPARVPLGARRLVALMRALVAAPVVVLLDEIASGLDRSGRAMIADRLTDITSLGTSVLLVDHDLEFVARVADRVIVLDGGSVIASESPEDVLRDRRVRNAYLGRSR